MGETRLPSTINVDLVVEDLPITDGVSGLRITLAQAREKRDLLYNFYAIFQPSSTSDFSLESLARRFTLPRHAFANSIPVIRVHLLRPPAQYLLRCRASSAHQHRHCQRGRLPHRSARPKNIPHYGREAGGAVYIEEMEYKNLSVVIDKDNWADEGVCFLWEGRK